jgi:Domain of unknown function (4846)
MKRKTITLFTGIFLLGCTSPGTEQKTQTINYNKQAGRPADSGFAQSIQQIPLPEGYYRQPVAENSFAYFLRTIPLKNSKTVFLYNGAPKLNQEAHYAILNIPVGNKDLQQCADAVMRLKAEYLFEQGNYSELVFRDNVGGVYAFNPPYTRPNLEKFLQRVFGMCGSASLEKELQTVRSFNDIQAGDVLIKGGFPGHAEIVTDIAVNDAGEKIYLLAQSYMPAQDIHIVKNPLNNDSNPWYEANAAGTEIITPEYVFTKQQLRRWPQGL